FIQKSALGAIGTSFLPQFLNGMDAYSFAENMKRLVVIQLSGGNDGLNTIVPFENDNYYHMRPSIAISKGQVLRLNDVLGMHPSLEALHELYKEGFVSIVNSVGYPNPNRSHFRSMDIWQSGVGADTYSKTGWIGRYMDAYCEHPHASIEIDSALSLSLYGEKFNGMALENSARLKNLLNQPYFRELIERSETMDLDEDNLGYLYKTLIQTNQSAEYIAEKHDVKNANVQFPSSKLGKDLNIVSQFIRSGLNSQVYYVSQNGYDTHVGQKRKQSKLLGDFAQSLRAFVHSLQKSKDFDNTLILVFSEFGRRLKQNGSGGTDHGKANNLFLIGKNIQNPGVYNKAPDLIDLDDGDVQYTIDFRNVYADVIRDWFGKNEKEIIRKDFASLGII
ncbi:MAG: DUF1501 domain-containing protein, partial [Bacteroidota bacterium]